MFTILPNERDHFLHVRKHIEHYAILVSLVQSTFYSFTGLATGFGDKNHFKTETLEFEVVDWKSQYHAILGR